MTLASLFMEHLFLDPGQFREGCSFGCPGILHVGSILSKDQLAAAYNAIPATFPWRLGYGDWRAAQHAAIQQLELTVKRGFSCVCIAGNGGYTPLKSALAPLRTPLKPSHTGKPR